MEDLAKEQWQQARLEDIRLEPMYVSTAIEVEGIERTDDLESKLKMVADIKNFGFEALGLSESHNYLRCRIVDDARTLYRLYVTPATILPDRWDNWVHVNDEFVHDTPYDHPVVLASTEFNLLDELEFYGNAGYDVLYREIHDFSDTQGCDLTPDFLERSIAQQAATIFHEDWHNTIKSWHPNKVIPAEIDEAAASLIGRIGAIAFTKHAFGKRSTHYKEAVWRFNKRKKETIVINRVYKEIRTILDSGLDDAEKIQRKKKVLAKYKRKGWTFDNAVLWDKYPYSKNLPLMAEAGRRTGSAKGFIAMMRDCPLEEDAAIAYLTGFKS